MLNEFDSIIENAQSSLARESTIPILSEKRLAEIRFPGAVEFKGRFWRPAKAGFGFLHQPVHRMAEFRPDELDFPALYSLGFKARVAGADHLNNGFHHLHILADLPYFTANRLKSSARRNIRGAVSKGIIVERITADDPKLLTEQGLEVLTSSRTVNRLPIPTRQEFLKKWENVGFYTNEYLILGGIVEDKLAALVSGYAIDGIAYIENILVAEEQKATNVGSLTIYAFVQACQRTKGITQIVNWKVQTDDPGLTAYKEKMGFLVTHVPILIKLRAPLGAVFDRFVRRIKPALYYNFYGKN